MLLNYYNLVLYFTNDVSEKKCLPLLQLVRKTKGILSPLVGQPFLENLVIVFG